MQPISLICMYLREWCEQLPQNDRNLVITGAEPLLVEICNTNIQELPDLRGQQLMTSYKEGWPQRFYRSLIKSPQAISHQAA